MRDSPASMETFEPRQLFAAAKPVVVVDQARLAADRTKIDADVGGMRDAVADAKATLYRSQQTFAADKSALALQLKKLQKNVTRDQAAAKATIAQAETAAKLVQAKWAKVLKADEQDVRTVGKNESAQEQAADLAKLKSDRAALTAELNAAAAAGVAARTAALAKLNTSREAVTDARSAGELKLRVDQQSIAVADQQRRNTFASWRAIVEGDLAVYRQHGGSVNELRIKLPKL